MQRLYYSISEVSKLLDEETYVLRYWEKEFNQISTKKNKSGNRIYSQRDIDIIKIVKKLLREDKLSIQGAKEQIIKFNFSNPSESLFDDDIQPNNRKLDNNEDIKKIKLSLLNNKMEEFQQILNLVNQF